MVFQKLKNALQRIKEAARLKTLSRESIEEVLESIEWSLVENDVTIDVAESLVSSVRARLEESGGDASKGLEYAIMEIMREEIYRLLKPLETPPLEAAAREKKPYVAVFLGINGSGKTTTIAKVAYRLKNKGFRPLLAAADTYRAGAIEQLKKHARNLGLDVVARMYGADPASVARDAVEKAEARNYDFVLVDTAGRMHTKKGLMEELRKIVRVAEPDENVMVIDALTGNDAIAQTKEFDARVGVNSLILTKIDADVKGGIILSLARETPKPVRYIGIGQQYPDLVEFRAEWVIENLFPKA